MATLGKRQRAGSMNGGGGAFHRPQKPGRSNHFGSATEPVFSKPQRAPIELARVRERSERSGAIRQALDKLRLRKAA